MSIQDGEFFSLFKRMLQKIYKDPSGTPGLTSDQLIRAHKRRIVTSNGAAWERLYVDRAVYVWTPDFRQIDYISGHHPGDLSADAAKPWNSAINVAKLYAPGEWHVKTRLLTGDTEGAFLTLNVSDAALGVEGIALSSADIAGVAPAVATNPNRSSFESGRITVVTADGANAVQGASVAVPNGYKLIVAPHPDNTDRVYVGKSKVLAQTHGSAWILDPGAPPLIMALTNWNALWVDAAVAGEGVMVSSEV